MSNLHRAALAQLDTQAFALMGRLHVIVRRESGRVTDIEYMRIDPAYCRHVLQLAGQISHEALPEICVRLDEIFFGRDGLFMARESQPLLAQRPVAPQVNSVPATSAAPESPATAQVENAAHTYIGRLR